MFCYLVLCVHSSFAIILMRKRELAALFCLSSRCLVTGFFFCRYVALWLFRTVVQVSLQCVIVLYPDHNYLFLKKHNCIDMQNGQESRHFKNECKRDIRRAECDHVNGMM